MNSKPHLLVLLATFLFLLPDDAFSQQRVSGTVRDAGTGSVLPGVNVVVKGTTTGAATNADGQFTVQASSATDTLVFSFIGYETLEEPIAGRSEVDVRLVSDVLEGDEVVVVGYGTQRKIDLTGSVAVIEPEDLKQSSFHSIEGALQGQATGVSVKSSGAPGETPEVRIRGVATFSNNDPLYIVDGVPVGDITDFSVGDIESVQVLKDAAAAAIYGTRAANGVVIITTNRGERNSGLQVEYDGSVGTSSIFQRIDMLDRQGYQSLMNDMLANAGLPPAPANDQNSQFFISNIDTDWQEETLKAGMRTQHDLSVSGGNAMSRYSMSGGYLMQEGTVQGPAPAFERYSVRVNSDHQRGRFTIGESAYFSRSRTDRQESRHEISLINNMLKAIPIMPIFDENRLGGYGGADANIERAITLNPIGVNNILKSQDRANRVLLNLWGQYEILDGLRYKLNFSYDLRDSEDFLFVPQHNLGFFFTEVNGNLQEFQRQNQHRLMEHTLTFDRSFGQHNLNLLAGFVREKNDYVHTGGLGEGYPTSQFRTLEAADGTVTAYHFKSAFALESQLGRVTYDYAGRYLLTASVRRDGSSRFGANNRYGVFPSVSAGWRISDEPFFNFGFFNDLKIRASWGQLGNQDIGDYLTAAFINTNANYNFNNQVAPGAIQVALSNSDIKWEKNESWDVGLDATMWDAKLLLTADYYDNKTNDILLAVPIPTSVGSLSNPTVNAATLRNTGFEVALTYQNQVRNFHYDVTANLTTWNNEVLSLGDGEPIYGAASITEEGSEVGQIFGYLTDGLFQSSDEICTDASGASCAAQGRAFQVPETSPGDIRFRDLNGDGLINADDRTYLGSAIPDFFYGLNTSFGYRDWDLSIFLQGTYGNDIFNQQRSILENMAGYDNYAATTQDRWTPQNTDTDMPRAILEDPNGNARASDRFVEDGSYLRLQNLTIGYTLPARLVNRLGGSRLRVYLSGENLFTITGYSGLDPDLGDDGDEVDNDGLFSAGFDSGAWPHPRIFRVGAQLRF